MPNDLRVLLLSAGLLFGPGAFAADTAPAGPPASGKATGIRFSGYAKDAAGRRLWTAEADTATSVESRAALPDTWVMERVRLTTFDKYGRKALTLSAPSARYSDATKTASDPGVVNIEGDALRLTGKDWKWSNVGETHTFTIDNAVRVLLSPLSKVPGVKEPPTEILARRLEAVVTATGKRLKLRGNVRVERDGTVMTCDELDVDMPPGGSDGLPGSTPAGGESFRSIDATGNVKIRYKDTELTGLRGRILPGKAGKGLYAVSGDARFSSAGENRVKVAGETMRYDALTHRIEVDPPADAADGRVTAEFQPIDRDRARSAYSAERAHASGKKLEILMEEKTGTLLFTGDVRLDDPDYTGSCDRLDVTFKHDDKKTFTSARNDTEALVHTTAQGRVSLVRKQTGVKDRTLTADKADFFHDMNRIVLTGSPAMDDAEAGVKMEAVRVTLDTSDKSENTGRLLAEGDAAHPVRATFDPRRRDDAARFKDLPGVTVVEAGRMAAERRDKASTFRFEDGVTLKGEKLSGTCDRLGLEVSAPPTSGAKARARIRHGVATGRVKLSQEGYVAEAGRAEIWPDANLRELNVADDNGMDGEAPTYVTLEADESTPGVRPKVTLPAMGTPELGGPGPLTVSTSDGPSKKEPTVIVADHQELFHGERRLRAFARKNVGFSATNVAGTAATLEMLATRKKDPANPAAKETFSPDAIIARDDVKLNFASKSGPRAASGDILEIFPEKDGGFLALTGNPRMDGFVTPPGIERKTVKWTVDKTGAKTVTRFTALDEIGKGKDKQIVRPRIILPSNAAPDLGRSLKSLDNGL